MPNPFDEIITILIRMEKMLKNLPAPSEKNVDLFRFMPVREIVKKGICSESTFYAHVRAGHITVYKFGNLNYVDRAEFEKAFKKVERKKEELKKVA